MGCDFPNKNVLKLFNETNKNEERFNNFVQLTEENLASTKKKKKTLTKRMTKKILLNIRKILKTLLNMHVLVVKHCVSHFKFIFFINYILTNYLMIFKMKKIEDLIFICNSYRKKIDCGKQLNMTLHEHITNNQ